MANIWLDDLRLPPEGFDIWIKDASYLFDVINYPRKKNNINILSLDHDLGENKPTGYDFCKWLVEKGIDNPDIYPKTIYLHTANGVGRDNMYQLLMRYKPDNVKVYRSPMPNND